MKKQIRLDKFLSENSGASRSQVKIWMKKGRITVNGDKEKDPGRKISLEDDQVAFDGEILGHNPYHYLMLHKPAGVISATKDDRDRTVMDLIRENDWSGEPFGAAVFQNVFPVGRLDKDTEGLLLMTDDGDLSHRLLSPKKHVDKCYYALLDGPVGEEEILAFERGLDIGDEKMTLPAKLRLADKEENELENSSKREGVGVFITICEGRFHQVKRMAKAVGREVLYLKRVSMGTLSLDRNLPAGACRPLSQEEYQTLISNLPGKKS